MKKIIRKILRVVISVVPSGLLCFTTFPFPTSDNDEIDWGRMDIQDWTGLIFGFLMMTIFIFALLYPLWLDIIEKPYSHTNNTPKRSRPRGTEGGLTRKVDRLIEKGEYNSGQVGVDEYITICEEFLDREGHTLPDKGAELKARVEYYKQQRLLSL